MMFWGCLRFEMNVHKPFFLCGHSFQNELGFQRRQRCLGGWNPKEDSALKWQEESNETGGFVAHDLARKV